MQGLFRLTGAKRRDSAVDAWLQQPPGELGEIARHWFSQFRDCGKDVLELLLFVPRREGTIGWHHLDSA